MINQRDKNSNTRKSGQGLTATLSGLALVGSLIGVGYLNHSREQQKIEDYSRLPETNLVCNGEYVDAVTAKGVDTDHFRREMRYDWFTNANPGKVRGNKVYGNVVSKVDSKYLAQKQKK